MAGLSPTQTRRLANAVARVGLAEPARRVHRRVSPLARRNHRDDENLKLLLAYSLRRDANCVDVGAHRGDILEQILRYAPDGRHTAFEPLPRLAGALARRFPSVEVRPTALSDTAGSASFTHVTTNPQLSGLRDRELSGEETSTFTVAVERLDDVLDPGRPIDLVKIDVEGAELAVLRGGMRTLTEWKPTVVFEHGAGGSDHFGVGPGEVYDLLAVEVGLRIFDIDGRGPYDRARFEWVYNQPIWLFVAHR